MDDKFSRPPLEWDSLGYRGHWDMGSLEVRSWFSVHQWLGIFVFFLAIAFLALGVCCLVAKDRISALLPIVLLLPAVTRGGSPNSR
jgi:hypothetical protein